MLYFTEDGRRAFMAAAAKTPREVQILLRGAAFDGVPDIRGPGRVPGLPLIDSRRRHLRSNPSRSRTSRLLKNPQRAIDHPRSVDEFRISAGVSRCFR